MPVIVIFTKFDFLDALAFKILKKESVPNAEAKIQAPSRASLIFEEQHLSRFYENKYPPTGHVIFRSRPYFLRQSRLAEINIRIVDMHRPEADCSDLVKKTAAALSDDTLQQLFVSTQQNSLETCIRYAIER